MRLLFITPYAPTPIRTRPYNLLRALRRRGHALTLVTPWENDAERAALHTLAREGVTVVTAQLTRARTALNLARALVSGRPLQALYCWEPGLAGQLAAPPGGPFEAAHSWPTLHRRAASASCGACRLRRRNTGAKQANGAQMTRWSAAAGPSWA